ncbi:MAG: phasin family protein [Pseudomonadota bacterium]
MADKSLFDIPTELRDLTEQCIKAQSAYGQLMQSMTQAMTQAMTNWPGTQSNPMAAGFKEVQDRAMEFAKENAESSFAMANDLANAKDMTEVLAIQSQYAQSQFQTYAHQIQELGLMTSEAMGSVVKKV